MSVQGLGGAASAAPVSQVMSVNLSFLSGTFLSEISGLAQATLNM